MNIQIPEISFDETHYLLDGHPLYERKFLRVMSFHPPGYAAVLDASGAFHIGLTGEPAYTARFTKTFGYYEGCAAVCDATGWYHIDPEGNEVYPDRYSWVGNFQEGRCVVKDKTGLYFHIDFTGRPAYPERYSYAGDFKYGIAVIVAGNNRATHIGKQGQFIHGTWYRECDIFHKGYAVAQDENGYLHIDKAGLPLYCERYAWAEPFYNGCALCRTFEGNLIVRSEEGYISHLVSPTGDVK